MEAVRAAGRALPALSRATTRVAEALASGGRLIYVGAGTSGRLGVLDASECSPTFGAAPRQVQAIIAGGPRALTRAVEGSEDDAKAGARALARLRPVARDVVCGVTASASTPFVRGALAEAVRAGASTLLVCCNPPGAWAARVDQVVHLETGAELIAGSTRLKAGTATKLALNALTTGAFVLLGKVYRGRMVDLQPTNAKLRARAVRMVEELTGLAPRQARALLVRAGGKVPVALAMHLTGLDAVGAAAHLETQRLRALEPGSEMARRPRSAP